MGILNAIKSCLNSNSFEDKIMKRIDKPTFYKDFSKEDKRISKLQAELEAVKDEYRRKSIEKEIYMLKSSLEGQGKVYFELKNVCFPFIGFHDLRLEYKGNTANIDFLIITHKFCCIIKSKNLSGNIEIDSKGNFNRWYKKDEKWNKEGMYSPVEQNRRSANLVKSILSDKLNINNMPVYSLVVLTNEKTTINTKECPKEIEKQVIRHDILNNTLKDILIESKYGNNDEQVAFDVAECLNKMNSQIEITPTKNQIEVEHEKTKAPKVTFSKDFLAKALKDYRLHISKENEVPPYFVFSNEEMERLLQAMPKTKEELKRVKGFGDYKVEKFGEDIINIING